MDASYCESRDTFNRVYNLVETPLEGHCDMYAHEESSSLGCNNVFTNTLDQSHVSTMCSQPLSSLEHSFDVPINSSMI